MDSVEGLNHLVRRAADRAVETLTLGGGQGFALAAQRAAGSLGGEPIPQTLTYDDTGTLQDGFRFGDGPGFGSRFIL